MRAGTATSGQPCSIVNGTFLEVSPEKGSPIHGMPAGAQNAVNKVQKGIGLAQSVANGDAAGAIQNAADMFPGDGPIQSSLQGVAALTKGDFKGALKSAVGLASLIPGGSVIEEALGAAGKLLSIFG